MSTVDVTYNQTEDITNDGNVLKLLSILGGIKFIPLCSKTQIEVGNYIKLQWSNSDGTRNEQYGKITSILHYGTNNNQDVIMHLKSYHYQWIKLYIAENDAGYHIFVDNDVELLEPTLCISSLNN